MNSILYQKLYNKLSKKLLSLNWMEKLNIDIDLIEENIKSESFIKNLSILIDQKDYSCQNVLLLCKDMMDEIGYPNIPENWLNYIYYYTLNKSFPEAVNITLFDELIPACELFLRVLRVISEAQKSSNDSTWQSLYPLNFLDLEEENSLERPEEYKKFIKAFKHNYTYEMMKLNQEVLGFNTLDHICGVHYLSLYIARQIKSLGIPVDLGRVSGAAAGHDIGKYGCKTSELKRVPYLHYYYSDLWFKRYGINYIRNIAIKHSTWDLELENLSIESLILIYSDFRVKNRNIGSTVQMHIFTLKDSFDVILSKLDNVDDTKEKRYRRVYEKLKDFEEYLVNLGVKTEISNSFFSNVTIASKKNYSLMQGQEIIQNFKYLAINHNVNLMYTLRDEYSLDTILELARSEKDWKNFREYIRIFQEYSTYLTQSQKLQTIKFLYENLVHPEDDIRRHCAEIMGTLIAIFDEDYRKEIPENVKLESPIITSFELLNQYMELLLAPGYKVIPEHKFWIGYSLSIMINSLFKSCQKQAVPEYRGIISKFYSERLLKNTDYQIFLLETVKFIPLNPYDDSINIFFDYVLAMTKKHSNSIRLCALEIVNILILKLPKDCYFISKVKDYFSSCTKRSSFPTENLIKRDITRTLGLNDISDNFSHYCKLDEKKISDIFLSNLKTATDWIKKKNQIDLLLQYSLKNIQANGLHTAIHFCNLLKVSAVEEVRNTAGTSILKLMPKLSLAERNEVAVELLRALEIEGNRFTEYIPTYVGQIILWLQPVELDEIIDDLKIKIKRSSSNVKSLILKTVGITISNYPSYKNIFCENEDCYEKRLHSMLGVLLNALGDYNSRVKQIAFSVLGKDVFGTPYLSYSEKEKIFKLIGKKVLTMVTDFKDEELLILTNSAALNHLYRFISDFTFLYGGIEIPVPKNVAFFPGTFDPFSLSHKEIAKSIQERGFEVYLAVDEFSWSKKTLPNLLRRNILSITIADELNIYIYPQSLPANLASATDLDVLKNNFPKSEVYIAVGSDVVLNASSYKAPKSESSIHQFNHIIFERGKNKKLEDAVSNIDGKVEWLTLQSKYSEISSSQIRNYIDESRDISSLVDPLAQQYIYENGFYQREPQEKSISPSLWLKVEIIEDLKVNILDDLSEICSMDRNSLITLLNNILKKPSGRLVLLKDTTNKDEVIGFSLFHWVRSSNLYGELSDNKMSQYIRDNSHGRIIFIRGIGIKNNDKYKGIEQILLTETLAFCLSKDYQFAIFKSMSDIPCSPSIYELLKLQGFKEIPSLPTDNPTFVVDMSAPCVLNLDTENILKEPFRSNTRIKQTIISTRKRLQEALTKLYPGELILSFDSNMLHQSLIRKICSENGVPPEPLIPRKLGSSMCVPYGDILERYVIPNTVTKALHTEKFFDPNMKKFKINQFPYYLSLKTQVKVLKSFERPIILVDNILHKGYRMQALDPLFKEEKIVIKKIISGILSGRGKDLMDMQNREVDYVYFVPGLKIWFNENSLYPFIGGDALWRGSYPERNLLPSINLIMPYTSPTFISGTSMSAIYNLSKVCIENSYEILSALENEYHLLHERNLSLLNLGQVITIPRCPDKGKDMDYDLNLSPSHYIKNDLELLKRFESIFRTV